VTYRYGVRRSAPGYRGIVYYYDETKDIKICLWRGETKATREEALDDAAERCQENNVDAEME
jgi:hypothetical protein